MPTPTPPSKDDPIFQYDPSTSAHERKTNSYMPFMPALDGHFQTHNTYRFVTVREQVLTVIGEAKHGMWRIQDNGLVRLYRKFGTTGVPIGADVYDPSLQAAITSDYKPVLIPGLETGDMIGGWAGYRYSQDADGDGQARPPLLTFIFTTPTSRVPTTTILSLTSPTGIAPCLA